MTMSHLLLLAFSLLTLTGLAQTKTSKNTSFQPHDGYWVTPEDFGCRGDSVTDDTEALQRAIDYCRTQGRTLRSTRGRIYAISRPLDLSRSALFELNFGGAEIKAVKAMDYMMKIDNSSYTSNEFKIRHKTVYNDLLLDCNGIAGGIQLNEGVKTLFDKLMVRNCPTKAFHLVDGYEVFVTNSHFQCLSDRDSYGLYLETGDSHFSNIVVIDAHTAVYQKTNGTNFFDKIHAWILSHAEGSTFFDVSGLVLLNEGYCDTSQKGYNMHGFTIMKLIGCHHLNNSSVYDTKTAATLFNFSKPELAQTCNITAYGCNFNGGDIKTYLSNIDENRIQFRDCFYGSNIIGSWGRYPLHAASGIGLQDCWATIGDNNVSLRPEIDQSSHLHIDATVEHKTGREASFALGTVPQLFQPKRPAHAACVLTFTDGSTGIGILTVQTDGQLTVSKQKADQRKTVAQVESDLYYK